jgi:hypothetical protein
MLPNLVSDRSRLPWLECLGAREDEVTASKKGGSGLLLKQFRLSDILQHCVIVFYPMIDYADFSVVVKNRATPPKPWCWEIYELAEPARLSVPRRSSRPWRKPTAPEK